MENLPDLALSVRQPWAWAIIHAGKDVENRGVMSIRHMRLDGVRTLAIHAAKGMTRDEYDDARDFMTSIGVACPAAPDGRDGGAEPVPDEAAGEDDGDAP